MAGKTTPSFFPTMLEQGGGSTWDAGHGQGTGQKGQESSSSSSGEGLVLESHGMLGGPSTSISSTHPGMRRWEKAGKGSIPCLCPPGAQGSCCTPLTHLQPGS